MKINDSNYVDLVVGHLNTPYGPVVSNSDLLDALRAGSGVCQGSWNMSHAAFNSF